MNFNIVHIENGTLVNVDGKTYAAVDDAGLGRLINHLIISSPSRVILHNYNDNKIMCIKAYKDITKEGLKECKETIESCVTQMGGPNGWTPLGFKATVIYTGDAETAKRLHRELVNAGATVTIE